MFGVNVSTKIIWPVYSALSADVLIEFNTAQRAGKFFKVTNSKMSLIFTKTWGVMSCEYFVFSKTDITLTIYVTLVCWRSLSGLLWCFPVSGSCWESGWSNHLVSVYNFPSIFLLLVFILWETSESSFCDIVTLHRWLKWASTQMF